MTENSLDLCLKKTSKKRVSNNYILSLGGLFDLQQTGKIVIFLLFDVCSELTFLCSKVQMTASDVC